MTMQNLIEIGVLPAVLVVLGGMLLLYASPAGVAGGRFLLYLLAVSVVLCCAVFIAARLTPEQSNEPGAQVSAFLLPTQIGVLALILPRLKSLRGMHPRAIWAVLLLGLCLAVLLGLTSSGTVVQGAYILAGALVLATVWALARIRGAWVIAVSAVLFAGLALLYQDALYSASVLPDWLRLPLSVAMLVLPAAVVPWAAVLIATGLQRFPQLQAPLSRMLSPRAWWPAIYRLGLAVLLLGYYAYTLVWLSIWDHTSDGLGGVWLSLLAQWCSIGAGMLMAMSMSGKRRVAGALFAVLVPLLVAQANQWGWDMSYHALTEERAAHIHSAVESFHAREGRYPAALGELVPRDLWWVEGPVILRGEDWCYEGGRDFFRLAAVYREFFSAPLSIRVYASSGQPPAPGWDCDRRLSALKLRYASYPVEGTAAPTPAPLPTSAVAVARTPMQPVAESPNLNLGSVSPDGAYLLFGLPEESGAARRMTLHFLDVVTGRRCQAGLSYLMLPEMQEPGLRERFAWLPGGRMLLIAQPGEVFIVQPCKAGVEDLHGRFAEPFSRVAASDHDGSHLLLRGESAYWVVDGATLQARRTVVSPNPYEFHWDRSAFSPSGEWLAIVRLNGRDKTAGSTLYIVQASTGEVSQHLPLGDASDQSAPLVEWLSNDQLLLHGQGALNVIDLRSSPPIIRNALRDFFGLDIAYPDDISSMASFAASDGKGYHLAVRVNHPRDQALYLYHAETGQSEVLQPQVHAVVILPDGQWADMQQFEASPTYRDEYDVIWIDAPGKPASHITVQGHVPRNYPMLHVSYLSAPSWLAFGSPQGVSLHALPGGETLAFWELGNGISTYTLAPKGGQALIAVVEGQGLYYLPLPTQGRDGDGVQYSGR